MYFIKKTNILFNFARSSLQHTLFFSLFFVFNLVFANLSSVEINTSSMPPPQLKILYPPHSLKINDTLIVEVSVAENWHVNANIVSDEFLKASSIEIQANGISFDEAIWPPYQKDTNEILEMEIYVFNGVFEIKIPIQALETQYDTTSTKAVFHYQACSNSICLAPNQVEVTLNPSNPPLLNSANSNLETSNTYTPLKEQSDIKKNTSFLVLLFFAFVGGLILNLMPCVLPVLSIKLFSLIKQSGESKKTLALLGLSTSAGVLVSFWALATVISVLQSAGALVGWGMQFQNPGFIAFMVAILSIFSMNFFGFFEIWLPGKTLTQMDTATQKEGLIGAFFTGALLVLLSTPCSAPFLGSAMGFAFGASTSTLFLFFTAAGLGLSTPYLLVALFPKFLSVLPKPGAWMSALQKWMGLLLIGTVVWLIWVIYKMLGISAAYLFSFFSVFSMLLAFIIGKVAPPFSSFSKQILSLFSSLVLLLLFWFLIGNPFIQMLESSKKSETSMEIDAEGWYPYSESTLNDHLSKGNTVFLYITADWCLTCKANETAVLSRTSFQSALQERSVVKLKADWTRESLEVNTLLKRLHRTGVPVYAVYHASEPKTPILLSELPTSKSILEAIDKKTPLTTLKK